MRLVYIANPSSEYAGMMRKAGWGLTHHVDQADLVMFTGGADVDPALYGEDLHPQSFISPVRDRDDKEVYDEAAALGIPMVGICRGGQFLNVMSGGSMYQHVDGHAIGSLHRLLDVRTGRILGVSSTHHQMMREGPRGEVLGVAQTFLTNGKAYMQDGKLCKHKPNRDSDVEVVLYAETNILCFQPHPEFFESDHECVVYFHELLEEIV